MPCPFLFTFLSAPNTPHPWPVHGTVALLRLTCAPAVCMQSLHPADPGGGASLPSNGRGAQRPEGKWRLWCHRCTLSVWTCVCAHKSWYVEIRAYRCVDLTDVIADRHFCSPCEDGGKKDGGGGVSLISHSDSAWRLLTTNSTTVSLSRYSTWHALQSDYSVNRPEISLGCLS